MTKKTHHVIPSPNGGWIVKRGGAERALKHFAIKKDAEDWARKVSINQKSELVIHKRDGTIQSIDSYNNHKLSLNKNS
jgi:hypothetical protein